MYAVVEKILNKKNIVNFTESEQHFEIYLNKMFDQIKLIENYSIESLTHDDKADDKYILKNDKNYLFVEKFTEVINGYFYNRNEKCVRVLKKWSLIPYENFENEVNINKNYSGDLSKLFDAKYPSLSIISKNVKSSNNMVKKIMEYLISKYDGILSNTIIFNHNKSIKKEYEKFLMSDNNIHDECNDEEMNKYLFDGDKFNVDPGIIIIDDCFYYDNKKIKKLIAKAKLYKKFVIHVTRTVSDDTKNNLYDRVIYINDDSNYNKVQMYNLFMQEYNFKDYTKTLTGNWYISIMF